MRFKKILVAVDFSKPSEIALDTAAAMAADAGAELVIVHVWQPNVYSYGAPMFPINFAGDYVRDAEQRLEGSRAAAELAGAKRVATKVMTGAPWHEIVELLKDPSFDLAILGTHGHTGLKHVLLGSVAEKVVRHAPCPVLVIRTRS